MSLLDYWKCLPDDQVYRQYCHLLRRPMEPFQYGDWDFVDQHIECCILRSRGGSKTKDFVDWLILRVLRTGEHWAWLSAKSGQLTQASIYFQQSPFFSRFYKLINRQYAELCTGVSILFGIISTSNLGLRLDGIIIDEEEDMEAKQTTEIYPQMFGMLITSPIHKVIHLGTRWINTKFDENCDTFPTSVHDWTFSPQIRRDFIAAQEKTRPQWEIDLLYRCLRTAPNGLVFAACLVEESHLQWTYEPNSVGIDINQNEAVIEIYLEGNECWVLREWEGDFVHNREPFRYLQNAEVEDGGYNEKEAELIQQFNGAIKQLWNAETKSARMTFARSLIIHIDPKWTPGIYKDLHDTPFDPKTGLYLKHPDKNPCHWLDAFLHALHTTYQLYRRREKVAVKYI